MRGTVVGAIAVASVCVLTPPCSAGTVVQTVNFYGASEGGVGLNEYNQMSPSLAPLNVVSFTTTASGTSLYNIINNSQNTQTVNVTQTSELVVGSYPTAYNALLDAESTVTYQITLTAFEQYGERASVSGSASTAVTTNLSQFVGTGQNSIDSAIYLILSFDNPSITFSRQDPESYSYTSGTSTVTYFYQGSFPEPASIVMMTVGLTTVAALACLRHHGH